MSPRTDDPTLQRRVDDWFSQRAAEYTAASDRGLWQWWRRRECAAIMALLRPRPRELVLDAGSGSGYYSARLLERRARVVALDLALPMAAAARRHLGIGAVAASLDATPFRPAFPAILCAGALEFCPNPEACVASMARALAPGGRLVVMLPAAGLPGRLYRAYHRRHGIEIHLFSRTRVAMMGRRAGLRLRAIRPIGFNWVVRFEHHTARPLRR